MFATVPRGFHGANATLNALPPNVASELIHDACIASTQKFFKVDATRHFASLRGEQKSSAISVQDVASAANAAAFIARGALTHKLSGDALKDQLAANTDLKEGVVALFVKHIGGTGGKKVDAALQLGKLVGLDWKLGVGVSSSTCKTLKAPFVSLNLRIADSNGSITAYPMELTLSEFHEFHQTFKNISTSLDSV